MALIRWSRMYNRRFPLQVFAVGRLVRHPSHFVGRVCTHHTVSLRCLFWIKPSFRITWAPGEQILGGSSSLVPWSRRLWLSIARTMLSQGVRPSVRLFVTRRYCVETAKHSVNFFFTFGYSHTILVFLFLTVLQCSDGDPLTGTPKMRSYEKSRFWNNISLYLGYDTR